MTKLYFKALSLFTISYPMKSLILSILVVVALGRFPAIAADVDVYLLGGQSNMQGQGSIADLTGCQRQLSNKVYFWNGRQFEPSVVGKRPFANSADEK